MGLRDWVVVLLCVLVAVGCAQPEDPPVPKSLEPVGQITAPLTSSELEMLGFETMTWASIWNPAVLSQNTLHSQGQFSLKISNIGYTALRHTPALQSDGSTFSVVGYDIRIPPLNEQLNPWWFGDTWLYIDAPSKGINQVTLGTKALKNPGQFTRYEFAIPAAIQTALAGNYSDLKFTIAINTTPGNGAHYLDRFTLGPGTCVPENDNNPCTLDGCNSAGQPTHTPLPAGTSCSDSNLAPGDALLAGQTADEMPLWSDASAAIDQGPSGDPATLADGKAEAPRDPRVALFELDDPDFCTTETLLPTAPFVSGITPLPNGTTIPYPICTAQQFATIITTSTLWSKNFVLMGDTDLSEASPAINPTGVQFAGVFDGNNHTLSNFSIQTTSHVGLFGTIQPTGVVRNLVLRDFVVRGTGRIGALAQASDGLIDHVTGINLAVSGNSSSTQGVGGLVGLSGGTVSNCTASVNMVAASTSNNVGGLVGLQSEGGEIVDCTVSGSVTRPELTLAGTMGGAVGRLNRGVISNTHSSVNITSTTGEVGGLAGVVAADTSVVGCSSSGLINVPTAGSVGGLVGYHYGAIVSSWSNCTVFGVGGVGGLVGRAGPASTIVDSSAQGDVHGTATYTGGLVGQTKGSVATSWATGAVQGRDYVGGLTGHAMLTTSSVTQSWASGDVSGTANHVGGLVGMLQGQLDTSYARGDVTGANQVGGLVGTVAVDGTVQDCASTANTVSGVVNVGGLIGSLDGSAERCFATANVTGDTKSGGLIGVHSGNVTDSYATGTVTANVAKAGGLVGQLRLSAIVLRAYSAGGVAGAAPRGGFAGDMINDSSLEDCHFNATKNPGLNAVGTNPGVPGVAANSDAALRQQDTFTNWLFGEVWGILEGSSSPFLQPVPSCAEGGCSLSCPCPADTCTTEHDCEPGQVCGEANGGYFDDPATDVCWDPLCETDQREQLCGENDAAPCGSCVPISDTCDDADADDGNPCTADSCDPVGGITHTPLPQGTSCDDGDLCNGADACDALGVCQSGTPLTCDDGNPCNGIETCEAETGCAAGTAPIIDDGNPCTADSCDPVAGVEHTPVPEGTSCEGDACDGPGTCDAFGSCQVAPGPPIDDGNPCTDDSCDPVDGVVHAPAPVGTPCDPDACTVGGSCDSGGFCLGGVSIIPDDGDPCTVETCDPETGVHTSVCTEDATVATTVPGSMTFLYTGANPAQQGVDPVSMVPKRTSAMSGRVFDRAGLPVPGVRVRVTDHEEFGFTNTQTDGSFQLVVNGGGDLLVELHKHPYLDAQRQVTVGWGEWVTVPDVVLLSSDTAVTTVHLTDLSEPFQVHQSTVVSDDDGVRQSTLLFPAGVRATMELPNGTQTAVDTLNVRITEFTVGDDGPQAMPGDLPPTSGYTYAFEIGADEAVAANAPSIRFDQPLTYYVDNFLDFRAGTNVPVGSYDDRVGSWKPEENGLVIDIVDTAGGVAAIDTDGDGTADADTILEALGIEFDERVQLAALYVGGQSLWRVPISHFTRPWDCNWSVDLPDDAEPPPDQEDPRPDPRDPCEGSGSIIECETQTLRESVPIAGTPFTLNYSSARVPGRQDHRDFHFELVGADYPASLLNLRLNVEVAGNTQTLEMGPAPHLAFDYVFDRQDIFGRSVQGRQRLSWELTYFYPTVYVQTPYFGDISSDIALTGNRAREVLGLTRKGSAALGIFDARAIGLGGWTLDVHNAYEPAAGVLQLGSGREITQLAQALVVESWPKAPSKTVPIIDDIAADDAYMAEPSAIAVGPDNTIYVENARYAIRRIDPNGVIHRFAGAYTRSGFGGDNGPALDALFGLIGDIEVGRDGSVYVADGNNHRVRRIDPQGIITTVAGNGGSGYGGDNGPATEAQLGSLLGLGLGRNGDLYIADQVGHKLRKVTADGIIRTIAAGYFHDVAEHPDGSVYAVEDRGIWRIGVDGEQGFIAGSGTEQSYGIPAVNAELGDPEQIVFGPDGTYYITDDQYRRVLSINPAGIVRLVASGLSLPQNPLSTGDQTGDGIPAADVELRGRAMDGLAIAASGIYFTVRPTNGNSSGHVYRTHLAFPSLGGAVLYVNAPDSDVVYVFDGEGRHLETRTSRGHLLYSFGYTPDGFLSTVADRDGNQTQIERAPDGTPLRIIAPFGQSTSLTLDPNGYVDSISDPLGHRCSMIYSDDGLLKSFTDARGNTSAMLYDEDGRLESDTDATGSQQLLSLSMTDIDQTMTLESGEGRLTSYQVAQSPDDTYHRVNTFPDGTQTRSEYRVGGQTTLATPDGKMVSTTSTPDPRFGMQKPLASTVTSLPSGLQMVVARARTVELADPLDPFGLSSEVSTNTINGRDWVDTYTSDTGLIEQLTPEGRWKRTYVDAQGRLTRSELPNILPVDLTYDAHGRLQTTTQGTRVRTNTYFNTVDGRNGYLQSATDSLSQLTSYERDAVGRMLDQVAPDTTITSFDWDDNSNLIGLTPPGKPEHTQAFTPVNLQSQYSPPILPSVPTPTTTFDFNLDRQPTVTWRPDGLTFERVYDTAGKLDLIDTPGGTVDYSYFGTTPCVGCAPGSLASIAHPSGVNLAYTYDAHLVTSTTWSGPVNGAIGWTYDNDFRVTTETVTTASATSALQFSHDADGLQVCASPTTCPTGTGAFRVTYDALSPRPVSSISGVVTDTLTYNTYGELASYAASASGSLVFREVLDATGAPRDPLGRIIQRTETTGGATVTYGYGYDLQGRLLEVRQDGDLTESYTYDGNGNRLSLDTPEGSVAATYDDQDRLLTYGDFVYTYTANGELLTKTDTSNGDVTAYEYDVFGNLVRVDLPDGDVIEYLVDGRNRRVGKRVNGTMVRQWLWADQLRIAAELDGGGNLMSRFVYGDKPATPELVIRGTAVYRLISDHLGSVRALVNIDNPSDVPVRLNYEAFGGVNGTGVGVVPQGFAGGLYDAETGLVRFGARDYEPSVGRWMSKDPIRFDGGVNVYVYANNDPLNWRDANGGNPVALGGGVLAACGLYGFMWGTILYPNDDSARHCYTSCMIALMCTPPVAIALGEGFELATGYSGDWREDREANYRGIDAALNGENCNSACEEPMECGK